MRTGIDPPTINVLSYSDSRQKVTIPADAVNPTLGFWIYTISSELTLSNTLPELTLGEPIETQESVTDFQYITILYENNNLREVLDNQLRNTQTWQKLQFDLSHYIDSSPIKLDFGTYNNGYGGVTAMYVDDVTLEVCK